jgi:ABC-type multidrug transport system fused ATPase/permease subunit
MGVISLFFLMFILIWTTIYKDKFAQGVISLMLTYSLNLQSTLFELLLMHRYTEEGLISMERCLSYTNIPSEKALITDYDKELQNLNDKECNWPSKGEIEFSNYSVKYRPDTEIVLKNISFKVKAGSKLGVVGRTGSGKSTLCLSLFRILEPLEGTIFIDGIDICNVGLQLLRSSLTIIPQDPSLMKGTFRYNIDPTNQYSDDEIKSVLDKLEISYLINNSELGLEQQISESGGNLSVGEKQLVCIARALLRVS